MPNNYTINNNISKATLSYVSNNDTKYIYPKTSSDNVVIENGNNTTLLSNKINNIKSRIEDLPLILPDESDVKLVLKNLIEKNNISTISIPSSVTRIGNGIFYMCTSLISISLPSRVTSIGIYAFYYCTSLTSISLPSNVTSIGDYAFWYCTSLTSVTFENNSQLNSIGTYAFDYCTSLTSINIPSSVTIIDKYAFYYCTALTSVIIPSSLTSIGGSIFYGCTNLEFVTLSNGFNVNSLSLSVSTKYSAETIISWLNALYDRTGLSSYRLTIGSTNLNKLTAEQKAIATNKNWTLS